MTSYKVYINKKLVNILTQKKPTVFDALVHGGKSAAEIMGRPGLAKTFKLNGKLIVIKGKMAKPAIVTMDGKNVDLKQPIHDGAVIAFKPAIHGEMAEARIKEYIPEDKKTHLKINDRDFTIDPIIEISGQRVSSETKIPDDAIVTMRPRNMILSDVFNIISFNPETIAGKLVMKINGQDAGFADPIKNNDKIDIFWGNMHK